MLIQNDILKKVDGKLKCNIAYLNKEFNSLMEKINEGLYKRLEKETLEIKKYITKIITKSIPNNLKDCVNGYVITLMKFIANNMLIDELVNNNFLNYDESIQISYFIDR